MRKILVLLAAIISLPIMAQEIHDNLVYGTIKLPEAELKSFNSRDFAQHLLKNPDHNPLRTGTRDSLDKSVMDSTYWINRIKNLPDYMIDYHKEYGRMVKEAINGQQNALTDPTLAPYNILNRHFYYPLTEWIGSFTFEYPMGATQDTIEVIANKALSDTLMSRIEAFYNFMPYLKICLDYDFPQAFWINRDVYYTLLQAADYSWNPLGITGTIRYEIYPVFVFKYGDIDIRWDEYLTADDLETAFKEYHDAIDTILKNLPDSGLYEKVEYLNDWLTSHNCYSKSYGTGYEPFIIRSPLSALKGSVGTYGPVCEGYARAFKVLCDTLHIPNTLVSGWAKAKATDEGELHMWNEIKMDDGLWYGVDVTWNDPVNNTRNKAVSGAENHNYLLVGKKTLINGIEFAESHPNSIYSILDELYYALLEVSDESYIADEKYEVKGTAVPHTLISAPAFTVHDITGRLIGRYPSLEHATRSLRPGLYIINGRKFAM